MANQTQPTTPDHRPPATATNPMPETEGDEPDPDGTQTGEEQSERNQREESPG
jgi:hypothetical protein